MKKHYKVIACNVMWREVCYYAALSPNSFRLEFLSWGLHTKQDKLRAELQRSIDATEDGFDAIILGYGLCSNGVDGIVARRTRLVITRGHDCMTCFLGSKERYRAYFARIQERTGIHRDGSRVVWLPDKRDTREHTVSTSRNSGRTMRST